MAEMIAAPLNDAIALAVAAITGFPPFSGLA
jgi:hypothetical protein